MRGLILAAATAVASIACAGAAAQAAIFINFDAVTTGADVDAFYDGGTDSSGASGPNLGVDFSGWTAQSGFGETSQPNFAYDSSSPATVDVAAGFSDALSFTQGFFTSGSVNVYSGEDGGGILLGRFNLPPSNPNAFAPVLLRFSGVAESVVFVGGPDEMGIDDLTLGAVPEASTWMMMLAGFAGLGFVGFRARRAARV